MFSWLKNVTNISSDQNVCMSTSNSKSTIKINGDTYQVEGNNIMIRNGKIIVDGKVINDEKVSVSKVIVTGNCESINCDGSVEINGDSGRVKCGGSCHVGGNVSGSVSAGGSVTCGNVEGEVLDGGSVKCRKS